MLSLSLSLGEVSSVVDGWPRGSRISNMNIGIDVTETFVTYSKMAQNLEPSFADEVHVCCGEFLPHVWSKQQR